MKAAKKLTLRHRTKVEVRGWHADMEGWTGKVVRLPGDTAADGYRLRPGTYLIFEKDGAVGDDERYYDVPTRNLRPVPRKARKA